MNIQELQKKIKGVGEGLPGRELYTALLIVLVGFASFGLGRLSKAEEMRVPIRIENVSVSQSASVVSAVSGAEVVESGAVPDMGEGSLVASKGGTKYHFPWCSGAQRISEANKIWFSSVEEARKAGYTPAANCKGLK
ncbi:MAG: hypothetical protein COV91_05300 [Candidatus Taylorbacteria bacterium CG11_big_fil_rev_8_21_14_0_20_46_11]|uniref:Ada DNA repair metal-binding domain-containing protein n=1 Tax=Candidatus Taylorbacteria bacterium CG11_big_fil_rev_8_21_14_0_20_46_11 TaxID=1975025 RepID=A0A2H0KC92_9BACT|nr:MAG: hypothetical protein COV91_05300 [Candidatus Taylorbacteria bacterium CG11_big_fil_rev_8_21_14_0_20_46_11]